MTVFYLFLAMIAGLCMALQSPTNATLSRYIGNLQATAVSFGGGALCLAALVLAVGSGDLSRITEASWWQMLGGIYGVTIVLSVTYAIPRLGAALTSTILMLGQLIMGGIIDTFGLMQMEAVPLAPGRVLGCLIVLAGIAFVYAGKKKQEKRKQGEDKTPGRQTTTVVICTFAAGVAGAMQAPTNTALALHVGTLEASFVSFGTGFLFILLITLIATKGRFLADRRQGVEWWMVTGGIYGGSVVFINLLSIPYLGAAMLMIATMLGQLAGGMLVDSFGLLRTAKIKMNTWRYAGMILIAIGVVFVAAC